MTLSHRGEVFAKVDFEHGQLNEYDASTNPDGVVSLLSAENASLSSLNRLRS